MGPPGPQEIFAFTCGAIGATEVFGDRGQPLDHLDILSEIRLQVFGREQMQKDKISRAG